MIGVSALAVLGLLAAQGHAVTMANRSFVPAQVTVVAGDTVTWTNADLVVHDVRAVDGSFASSVLERFAAFTAAFPQGGARPYLCSIHPFMRGEVDVVGALLAGPARPVIAGAPVRIAGRAAPGAVVTLEGAGGSTVAAPDGAFGFVVVAAPGAVYRALTAAGPSPPLALDVVAGVRARLSVRPGRRTALVRVRSAPPVPGTVARLERRAPGRVAWRPAGRAHLDARGRARFRVRSTRRGRVRVLIGRAPDGTPLAVSPVVRVRDGRREADPVRRHAKRDSQ